MRRPRRSDRHNALVATQDAQSMSQADSLLPFGRSAFGPSQTRREAAGVSAFETEWLEARSMRSRHTPRLIGISVLGGRNGFQFVPPIGLQPSLS